MKRAPLATVVLCSLIRLAAGQPAGAPAKFEFADIRPSVKTANPFRRTGPVRAGRYEVKTATMVDLIQIAYDISPDKILGGPNWLELDRFDVAAKVPPDTTPEALKPMLQALLEERFKLVLHKDTKSLPTWVLVAGKKPLLKEAAGTEEPGCKPESGSSAPGEGAMRVMMNMNGNTTTLNLGPGGTIQYNCRNTSMAAFAAGLGSMLGAGSLGPNPVQDDTGLKGKWNFDIRWTFAILPMNANSAERVSVPEAIEKQLGLKLEERQIPTPVMVVDSANRAPSAAPAGTAEALPATPPPTEFEVASVKPADPDVRMRRFQAQPGGRLTVQGMPLHNIVARAFSATTGEAVTGLPPFADSQMFDIEAKVGGSAATGPADLEAMALPLRALLADRFKMTYHTENQPVTAYSLVTAKPRMKKADPASRIFCKFPSAPPGAPPGSRVLTCQNTTMEQLAERLQLQAPELSWPVLDATGLEGGWDFTLTWSQNFGAFGGRGGDAGQPGAGPSASDPSGGLSLFEAIEKQLGLKLEKQKRPMPVIVVDHIEPKPTEN